MSRFNLKSELLNPLKNAAKLWFAALGVIAILASIVGSVGLLVGLAIYIGEIVKQSYGSDWAVIAAFVMILTEMFVAIIITEYINEWRANK